MRGTHAVLLARLAILLATIPARSLVGQGSNDTTKYVILSSHEPIGYYNEWVSEGALHSIFEYNDRGPRSHQEALLRVDADDFPTMMKILGHNFYRDTVDERLSTVGGTLTWNNTLEHGTKVASAHGFYYAEAETPTGLLQLVLAGVKRRGPVALLPGGTATIERVGDLTIAVGGRAVRLLQYAVGGIGFTPTPVWVEESRQRFATVSTWFSVVPEEWQQAVPTMLAAQEKARTARLFRLAAQLPHRPSGPLVIQHVGVFVAESALVRATMTVVVTGNRITAVGPDDRVQPPRGAWVIDAAGKTLLPGLWDMHVHIAPGEDGLLFVAAGVTTTRDMGNDTVMTLDLQRRFATDSLIGPRLILAGLIDGSGPYQESIGMLADDSVSARLAVDWYAAHGYEQIKIYNSLKPELVPEIIAEAHAKGLRVSGHVPAFLRAEDVIRDGFDEVQHVNYLMLNFMDTVKDARGLSRAVPIAQNGADLDFSSPRVGDFITLFKTHHADIDPTLVAWEDRFTARPGQLGPSEVAIADRMPPQVRRGFYEGGLPVPPGMDQRYRDSYAACLHMVKVMYDGGVPIVAGTDMGPAGFTLFREFELYVQAGIPANRVLQLATIGAARIMHHDDERGSITTGKLADLVLVDGDPTTHISDIRRTALVVKNGLVYRPAEVYRALGVQP